MKIQQLKIGGFGRLRNRELELGDGVTVLYGRNEAGKSTTLQFMRAMLFGIPGRANPESRYEPMQGGIHGGTLSALDDSGVLWSIRRYTSGAEQGRGEKLAITASHPDGRIEELQQNDLERRLLGGMSRQMFHQLFAISLDELQELGALQSEEMSSYLFHAGMGGGGEIMRAEKRLVQEADKLYKPRGKVQEAAKVLQSIEKLEREVAESRSYLPRYNANLAALEQTELDLARAEEARGRAEAQRIKLRKALDIRGLWLKWRDARLELAELPLIEAFPEHAADRWQVLESSVSTAQSAVFRLKRQEGQLTDEIGRNPPDALLEAQGPLLEQLDRRRSVYEDRKAELQRLEAELAALQDHLQRELRSIDAGWGRAELAAFTAGAADREAARRYASAFSAYDRRMEAREAERQQLRTRLVAAAAALQAAERALAREAAGGDAFAGLAPRSPRETLQLWDELQQAAERWREAQLGGEERRGGSVSRGSGRRAALLRRGLAAGAALTLLLPAALWLTDAPPVSFWSALGLLAAADLALWAGLRAAGRPEGAPPQPGGADPAAAEMLRLRGLLLSGAEPESALARPGRRPGGDNSPDAQGLEAGMRELRRLMEGWKGWRQRIDQLGAERDACRLEVDKVSGQERALAEELERAEAEFMELDGAYGRWLAERRLPEGLSPEGLPDIFARVEQGNELLRQENKLLARLRVLTEECAAYEDEVYRLRSEAETAWEAGSRNPESGIPNMNEAANGVIESTEIQSGIDAGMGYVAMEQQQTGPAELRQRETRDLSLLGWLELRIRSWDSLKNELLRRDSYLERMREIREELVQQERELDELHIRRAALLREGGAGDGEDLLRRAAAAHRREELSRSVRQWELAMFGGWESGGREELLELLEQRDAEALAQQLAAADAEAAGLEEERTALLQQRGKLMQEREYLKERCMKDNVLQQLEEQRAALRGIAAQYAVHALAAELIGRTRRIYEQEKQPEVLRLASAYFSKLTGGEYRRIVMTFGHKELKAEHRETGLLDSTLLSRGTAEQLYLAIRLALAETMSRQVRLPLLFDDLFVNFDDGRLGAALELIGELGLRRQIVMMTCHRHVAEAAARIIPAAVHLRV
ncbi:AAA family ATPase [Paenibacillus tepidiphilus]|uniref:AAA family ATPase n=1 Tax=Paenibacillus tepidiphilus TaxID=2608683 RepID=UPI00123983A4|nr:AAA family ATPase [Paenibacillus tepidiphilus]